MSTQSNGGFNLAQAQDGSISEKESAGVWVSILDVEQEPMTYGPENKPVRILVAGTYSKQFREVSQRQSTKMVKNRRGTLTGELLAQNAKEAAAACTLAWEGFFYGDATFECNKTNALALYTAAPHIQEQVEAAMQDHAAFFKSA